MKGKTYAFFRRVVFLPRPNELWNDTKNSWTFFRGYLYCKMCIGEAMSHFVWPISIFGFTIQIATWLELRGINTNRFIPIFVIGGVLSILAIGHVFVVLGTMKRQSELASSQSPDIREIRENTREILRKLQ